MTVKKRGLGRGLDVLLGSSAPGSSATEAGDELRDLALDHLVAGKFQPRRRFDDDALRALADSIRAQGVVQPIVVRAVGGGRYEIVAGERRWRAARLAGLDTIPAVVRPMEDRAAMAVALVENIQRADLNPLEEAEALRRLIDDCGLTHEQTAAAVGRSRAAVSNLLRLMELDVEVQALLRDGRLTLGHAKVLLGALRERQAALARQVVADDLSVRATETLLAQGAGRGGVGGGGRRREPTALEADLSQRLRLAVRIRHRGSGGGSLVIDFKDRAEFDRLLAALK